MDNGTAYISKSTNAVPVYKYTEDTHQVTNIQIGAIYMNECFGIHPAGEWDNDFVVFRNASGVVDVGVFGNEKPIKIKYVERKSNGSTLLVNSPDSEGYYTHTLSKAMNWYIKKTQQPKALPAGTQLKIKDATTGGDHYTRMACKKAKQPGENVFTELNPGDVFFVDYITTGSMPGNRSIY